ncbi:MAG: isocitrate/isopropylmalate family dehydrogenase, partial [Anaerolineae bacterium]
MHYTITLLPGDGIGPEIIAEARKVLETVLHRAGHTVTFQEGLIGGIAIDET